MSLTATEFAYRTESVVIIYVVLSDIGHLGRVNDFITHIPYVKEMWNRYGVAFILKFHSTSSR